MKYIIELINIAIYRGGLCSGVAKVGTGGAQAQPISYSTLLTQVLTVRS